MNHQTVYEQIITNARCRQTLPERYEVHHIIPKCLGGTNDEDNLVKLTLREHFVVHLLLAKMYGGALHHAAMIMTGCKKYGSRKHEWLKKNIPASSAETRDKISKKLKGRPKSEEWKEKVSKPKKNKENYFKDHLSQEERNEMYGKHSKGKTYEEIYGIEKAAQLRESRRKTSSRKLEERLRDKSLIDDVKKKLSAINKGKTFSKEVREKMSIAHTKH